MTPLQQAAQAVIDRWQRPNPSDIIALRKALDAEIAQSVEPVAHFIMAINFTVGCIAYEYEKHNLKSGTPLYLHPPQQAEPKNFVKLRAQLEQEWVEVRAIRDAYKSVTQQSKQVPLSDDQIIATFCTMPDFRQYVSAFKAGVKLAEKHHGIGGEA